MLSDAAAAAIGAEGPGLFARRRLAALGTDRIADRAALVCGAGIGITGAAIAPLCAATGGAVVAASVSAEWWLATRFQPSLSAMLRSCSWASASDATQRKSVFNSAEAAEKRVNCSSGVVPPGGNHARAT